MGAPILHEWTHAAASAVALAHYGVHHADELRASIHAGKDGAGEFILMPDPSLPAHLRVQALASGALGPLALIPTAPRQLVLAVTRRHPLGDLYQKALSPEDMDWLVKLEGPPLWPATLVRAVQLIRADVTPLQLAKLGSVIRKASLPHMGPMLLGGLCPQRIARAALARSRDELHQGMPA